MRGFIILCFAALSLAAPEGYNYNNQLSKQQFSLATNDGTAFDGRSTESDQQQLLISKNFFLHSAPEESEDEIQHRDIVVGQPRKNFNVVFIKSPAGAAQKTKIRVIPAVNEEKTAIYVLTKKANENEVIAHVEEPLATTAKPEVFFIKYKTDEEAEHAQHSIQAEYDRLGGSSSFSNERTASVSSVIGSLEGHGSDAGNGNGDVVGSIAEVSYNTANAAYLPPANKY